MHHSVCEICYMKFTADKKWQTIVELLAHKKTCISHQELNIYRTQQDCDECGYKSKNETDLKHHLRDAHLNNSSSSSPPPKKQRPEQKDFKKHTEESNIVTDDLILKLDDMDITENELGEEENEKRKRSAMMDQKVAEINRKRDEEEKRENERKIDTEKKIKEREVMEKEELKRQNSKRKNYAKKKKNKYDRLEKLGISEIDEKHHKLVGKYKYRLKIPGNGNCQCASKAACLLGDPSAGPNLANQENGYIVEHWEGYFDNFFFFPQTLQLGGGKTLTVQNPEEFLQFLVLNPEASHMWADHHQLHVTANLYNTTVQVLTIDERGNGSLLHQPFRPDPRLADYALLPATKPNGEKVEVEEVWLLYSNGNHYNALIAEDGKIMTMGIINNLEQESDLEKYLNDIDEVTKVENLTSKEKEEESNVHIKLKQEIKDHNETKKSLKALEVEYNKCKTELRVVNEEKERLKIEGNDLKK